MSIALFTERRTTADAVFENLYDQIISLNILPGTKMSEAEVADLFGVSRQPVRDAFNRLASMNLLLIQPQKATLVQKFSLDVIQSARFVRLGIELEIARAAAQRWTQDWAQVFDKNLEAQNRAVQENDSKAFHTLDEDFHAQIAKLANQPAAFELVLEKKALVDRICVLSLKQGHEMQVLVDDHRKIVDALSSGDASRLDASLREHLSRIEKTINRVQETHSEYFES